MCGIAGLFAEHGLPDDSELRVRKMLAAIRYRGPDQFGLLLADDVALGSARLSIIDLGGGQQPISTQNQRYWIVYNGEIFNFIELRVELEQKGYQFATHTDTEVLLNLYQEEGPACLNKLNGQFALAIYDTVEKTLFLARDRLGVRPLFYSKRNGVFYFGSEIKCLLAGSGENAEISPAHLGHVFTFWGSLPGQTVFKGINELRPGHWMLWRQGNIKIHKYWDSSFEEAQAEEISINSHKSVDELKEELKNLLIESTQIRLRADVPVGSYLSGGLDSSLIASIVRQHTSNNLRTFSIAFTDERYDERDFQLRMAKFLGTEHEVVEATHEDIGEVFPEVVWHTETPLLRTAPVPMYLLSQRVHQCGYKVVLTGEGADEFFAGYDIFKEAKVRRFWARYPDSKWRFRLLEKLYPDVFHSGQAAIAYLKAFFGNGLEETKSVDYSHAIRWKNTRRLWRFMTKEALAECGNESAGALITPYLPSSFMRWNPLQRAQYLEINFFMSQYLLSSQGDRVAMANSVEGRFPFLDVRLIEWSNRLPVNLKMYGLEEKYLLRLVGKESLPPEIWQRVKRPYRAPIHRSFFHEHQPAYVREMLSEESIRKVNLFQPAAVKQLVEKVGGGKPLGETDDMALAGILSAQLLHYRFTENFPDIQPIGDGDDIKVCKLH
jgi:asparagine synthase (glutamine-hydrolysing)